MAIFKNRKVMKLIKYTLLLMGFLLIVPGCRKDESNETVIMKEPTGDPTIEVVSGVTGFVTNENGDPVSNAKVTVYNQNVETDDNGVFYLNNTPLNRSRTNIRVEKQGFIDGFKTIEPILGKKSFVEFRLISNNESYAFNAADGGVVEINGSASILFDPNTIVVKDGGAPYEDLVRVKAHWYNPQDPLLGKSMPGNLLGKDNEGQNVQLGTYGMMHVELFSVNQSIPLQLADGATAKLLFPQPDLNTVPDEIPLWYFDEMEGVWIEEGKAVKEGDFYLGEVAHFSFWNCDYPFPLVEIEGRLVYNSEPLTNFEFLLENDEIGSAYGFTNNEGVFKGKVPRDIDFKIISNQCDVNVLNENFGPFNSDGNIGDVEVDLNNFLSTIKGRMVDCFNEPIEDAYGLLRSGEKIVRVITPLSDGTFTTTLIACEQENYSLEFIDWESLKTSGIIPIQQFSEVNNLEDIRLCIGIEEFLQYTRVGGFETFTLMEMDAFVSNDEKLIIKGYDSNLRVEFELNVFGLEEGNYIASGVINKEDFFFGTPDIYGDGDHINNLYDNEEFKINITEFGQYITGDFSGTLRYMGGSNHFNHDLFSEHVYEGSFRCKIDDYITTGEISGQFWYDENNNNLREENENLVVPSKFISYNKLASSSYDLNPSSFTVYNGKYRFINLEPNTYEILVNSNSEDFQLVTKDAGNDSIDSDFEQQTPTKIVSNEIVLTGDEVIENVDIGYQLPDSLFCNTISVIGCVPNLEIRCFIESGVAPYTVKFNGQDSIVNGNVAVFYAEEGGFYSIEVIDAIDNVCTSMFTAPEFNNEISGFVWQDGEGATPNFRDPEENGVHDLVVFLFDPDGNLLQETVTHEGTYSFSNLAPGVYYIELENTGNFELVSQNVDITNGSDLDPETWRSSLITVGDCDFSFEIDAGLD